LKTEEKERIHEEIEAEAKELFESLLLDFPQCGRGTISMGEVVLEIHSTLHFPLKGNKPLIKQLESIGWKHRGNEKRITDTTVRNQYSGYKMYAVMWKGRGGFEWKEPL
jgi:hypothetical protein